jgi:hypothetical protein
MLYEQTSIQFPGLNIIVWNMHLPEQHQAPGVQASSLVPMGKGGGFRVLVFEGQGTYHIALLQACVVVHR